MTTARRQLNVAVPGNLHDEISAYADRDRRTLGTTVRMALEEFLAAHAPDNGNSTASDPSLETPVPHQEPENTAGADTPVPTEPVRADSEDSNADQPRERDGHS